MTLFARAVHVKTDFPIANDDQLRHLAIGHQELLRMSEFPIHQSSQLAQILSTDAL